MGNYVDLYEKIWHEAAESLSAEISSLAVGVWEVKRGEQRTLIHNYRVRLDDPVILNVAGDKPLCYRIMAQKGLPVPEYETFTLEEMGKAKRFMDKFQKESFVVKPAAGTAASKGVSTHLRLFHECRRAAALASLYSREILIEQMASGESYRLLVLNGEVIHISRRRGVRVKGDGSSAIRQLMKSAGYFHFDRDVEMTLYAQGMDLEFILGAGREVLVKSVDDPSGQHVEKCTFYDEDVTDQVCQDIRQKAIQAAVALGSQFAGVDIITLDPGVPLQESGGIINEVNTTPGLHHHYGLLHAQDPPPAVHVLKYLLNASLSRNDSSS